MADNHSDEDILHVGDLVSTFLQLSNSRITACIVSQIQKGAASARANDTKGLKGPILDWITPCGGSLNPPLARNDKSDWGFNHETTGALLCPTEYDWNDPE